MKVRGSMWRKFIILLAALVVISLTAVPVGASGSPRLSAMPRTSKGSLIVEGKAQTDRTVTVVLHGEGVVNGFCIDDGSESPAPNHPTVTADRSETLDPPSKGSS